MGQNPMLTNVLLFVIAALLLTQVIQTATQNRGTTPRAPMISNDYHAPAAMPSSAPPAATMDHSMVFAALKAFPEGCSGMSVLAECDSPAARVVKERINKFAEGGRGPRQIFDFIVATWGEKVLTDQALQIRQMRTKRP